MQKRRYISWKDEERWLGYLEEYPDHMTQGQTLEDLEEHLKDIYRELTRRRHGVSESEDKDFTTCSST